MTFFAERTSTKKTKIDLGKFQTKNPLSPTQVYEVLFDCHDVMETGVFSEKEVFANQIKCPYHPDAKVVRVRRKFLNWDLKV